MQNVIIIEDNTERQQTEYSGNPLNEYSDILHNAINTDYETVFNMLKKKNFNLDYDVIIAHESAFQGYKEEIIGKLKKYCKKNKKELIFFSGGQINIVYKNKVLYLPSHTMYRNLMDFLQPGELNIKILAYGKKWKINALNSVYQNINKYFKEMKKTNKMIRTSIFKKEVSLEMIEEIISNAEINDKTFLEIDDVEKIKNIIKKEISEQI